jgi:hypothetical protein
VSEPLPTQHRLIFNQAKQHPPSEPPSQQKHFTPYSRPQLAWRNVPATISSNGCAPGSGVTAVEAWFRDIVCSPT